MSLAAKSAMKSMERGVHVPTCFPIITLRRLGSSTRKSSGTVTCAQTTTAAIKTPLSAFCIHNGCMHNGCMGVHQIAYACTQPVRMRRVDGQQCAGCILPEYEAALETFLKPLLRGSTFTSARELLSDRVRSVRLQVSSQSRLDSTILQNSSWSPLTPIL